MAKKKFTAKVFKEVYYEVIDEYWLDEDTYVLVFQDMEDGDGDTYHLEVEYHKDEERITYTRVYEYDTLHGEQYVSPSFRMQIDEYILKQVGVIDENYTLFETTLNVKLKLAVPLDMSVDEYQNYLKDLQVGINSNVNNGVKVIDIKNESYK